MKPAEKAPGGDGRRRKGESRSCPLCGKATMQEFRPFCSKRCAEIDLGRWLRGAYAIPGERAEPGEGDSGET